MADGRMARGLAREKPYIVWDPSTQPRWGKGSAMKVVVNNQVVLSQVPEGPIAPYLGVFADSLGATGYSVTWIHRHVLLGACFSQWLEQKPVALPDITADLLRRYLKYRARRLQPRCGDHAALVHLVEFLRRKGVVPEERLAVPEPFSVDHHVRAYEVYLREGRALATATIVNYAPFVRDFLKHRFGAGSVNLPCLSAADVVRFVRHQAPRLHRKRAKLMTTALRSFLSYARFCGEVNVDLAAAVPVVPNWSMASIPRAIAPEQVRQLLASIDRHTATGRRDYAIVLLLARLGLRSGEVASLKLDDIDWKSLDLRGRYRPGKPSHRPVRYRRHAGMQVGADLAAVAPVLQKRTQCRGHDLGALGVVQAGSVNLDETHDVSRGERAESNVSDAEGVHEEPCDSVAVQADRRRGEPPLALQILLELLSRSLGRRRRSRQFGLHDQSVTCAQLDEAAQSEGIAAPAASPQPPLGEVFGYMVGRDTEAIDLALVKPGCEVLDQANRCLHRCRRVALGTPLLGKDVH
jgi:integrase/recombinase XerD